MRAQRQPVPDAGQRLIDTAVDRIRREGMSVGLDHLSLERVIAESGVSRATAYRRWPRKADFLRDVLVTVVRSTRLEWESAGDLDGIAALVGGRARDLQTAQGRRNLVVESLRLSVTADIERLARSPSWRTYVAITATCQGLPAGDLRGDVERALVEMQETFVAHRAAVYRRLPPLLGYRLVPPLADADGYLVMSAAAGAMMTGIVVTAAARPKTMTETTRLAAYGSTEVADWSLPAHHLVGVVLGHLEPDPRVRWGAAQVARSLRTLEELAGALGELRPTGGS